MARSNIIKRRSKIKKAVLIGGLGHSKKVVIVGLGLYKGIIDDCFNRNLKHSRAKESGTIQEFKVTVYPGLKDRSSAYRPDSTVWEEPVKGMKWKDNLLYSTKSKNKQESNYYIPGSTLSCILACRSHLLDARSMKICSSYFEAKQLQGKELLRGIVFQNEPYGRLKKVDWVYTDMEMKLSRGSGYKDFSGLKIFLKGEEMKNGTPDRFVALQHLENLCYTTGRTEGNIADSLGFINYEDAKFINKYYSYYQNFIDICIDRRDGHLEALTYDNPRLLNQSFYSNTSSQKVYLTTFIVDPIFKEETITEVNLINREEEDRSYSNRSDATVGENYFFDENYQAYTVFLGGLWENVGIIEIEKETETNNELDKLFDYSNAGQSALSDADALPFERLNLSEEWQKDTISPYDLSEISKKFISDSFGGGGHSRGEHERFIKKEIKKALYQLVDSALDDIRSDSFFLKQRIDQMKKGGFNITEKWDCEVEQLICHSLKNLRQNNLRLMESFRLEDFAKCWDVLESLFAEALKELKEEYQARIEEVFSYFMNEIIEKEDQCISLKESPSFLTLSEKEISDLERNKLRRFNRRFYRKKDWPDPGRSDCYVLINNWQDKEKLSRCIEKRLLNSSLEKTKYDPATFAWISSRSVVKKENKLVHISKEQLEEQCLC